MTERIQEKSTTVLIHWTMLAKHWPQVNLISYIGISTDTTVLNLLGTPVTFKLKSFQMTQPRHCITIDDALTNLSTMAGDVIIPQSASKEKEIMMEGFATARMIFVIPRCRQRIGLNSIRNMLNFFLESSQQNINFLL